MKVALNQFGFHEVVDKPTAVELSDYYTNKYFQSGNVGYTAEYGELELAFSRNVLKRKLALVTPFLPLIGQQVLLDVGCGEGFSLPYFAEQGWNVRGADFSEHAITHHHPAFLDRFIAGDIEMTLDNLNVAGEQFSVIWLDNVLEHVLDPYRLLQKCLDIVMPGGVILIDVPNDYSTCQMEARRQGLIDNDFWVVLPDHLSYFNRRGLQNLAAAVGWEHCRTISDFPIDFNLFHPLGNYIKDRAVGKAAHQQRMLLDVFLTEQSAEQTLNLYQAMADMGIGRSINSVFRKNL